MSKNAKRILAVILSIVTVVGMFFTITSSAANYLGDINQDGKISASDARKILRVAALLDECLPEIFYLADVNGDGKISATDARTTLRMSALLEDMIEVETMESPTVPDKENASGEEDESGPSEETPTQKPTVEPSTNGDGEENTTEKPIEKPTDIPVEKPTEEPTTPPVITTEKMY